MEREAKTKVDASVWGAGFVQFFAALDDLPRSVWNKRLNSSNFSKSTEANSQGGKELNQFCPPKKMRRPLHLLLSPSLLQEVIMFTIMLRRHSKSSNDFSSTRQIIMILQCRCVAVHVIFTLCLIPYLFLYQSWSTHKMLAILYGIFHIKNKQIN